MRQDKSRKNAAGVVHPRERWRAPVRIAGGLIPSLFLAHAGAQTVVGPGNVATTVIVNTGITTIVGGTTVATPGYAAKVNAGTLVLEPGGATPGPIALNATAFNSFSIYATGGTVEMRSGPTSFFTSGNASSALWV